LLVQILECSFGKLPRSNRIADLCTNAPRASSRKEITAALKESRGFAKPQGVKLVTALLHCLLQ
jgi:hypothetical protein